MQDLVARPATARVRGLYLPVGWPFYTLFLGFPLWWALGLGGFIWLILAVPMLAWLIRQPTVLAPKGFTIWIAFLLWIPATATQLDNPDRYIAFAYRASLYLAATIVLLYVFNISREALPTSRIISTMAVFWMVVVAGGFLGVIVPELEFRSPVEMLMPKALVADEFVYELVHPATAQIHDFLGYAQPRPTAPFVYSTNWGSAFGLLVPFVILGWRYSKTRSWRTLTAAMFVAGMVPVVSSLDRGLWLSLGVGLVYAAVRLALGGQTRALRAILVLIPTLLAVVYLSPLKTLVVDRFANPHSNERRIGLYQETLATVQESPVLGFGSPRPSVDNPNAPSVGTQGQLWLVLFSFGIPGAVLFLWWFVYQFWRMRKVSSQLTFWVHTMLLIALIQIPFYGLLPAPLVVIMVAIAVAARETLPVQGIEPASRPSLPSVARRGG